MADRATPPVLRAPAAGEGRTPLHPAFVLAATINDEGCIELPAGGRARLHVWPGEDGAFLHRVVDGPAGKTPTEPCPLDSVLLAQCLGRRLGALTPDAFLLTVGEPGGAALLFSTAMADRERLQLLRDAFAIYLGAYKDRVV